MLLLKLFQLLLPLLLLCCCFWSMVLLLLLLLLLMLLGKCCCILRLLNSSIWECISLVAALRKACYCFFWVVAIDCTFFSIVF
jgi:hypothetical protein